MKKLLFFVSAIALLFLTGCDNDKTLTCTTTDTSEKGLVTQSTFILDFHNFSVDHFKMEIIIHSEDEVINNHWDNFANSLQDSFSETKDSENFKMILKNDSDNKIYSVIYDVNTKDITQEEINNANLPELNNLNFSSYNEAKESFEKDGYTCQ